MNLPISRIAQRSQFAVYGNEKQRFHLLKALAKAKVSIVAFLQKGNLLVFAPGAVDPLDPTNRKQTSCTRHILSESKKLKWRERTVFEIFVTSEPPGTLYRIEKAIEKITSIRQAYVGKKDTLWFQVKDSALLVEKLCKSL
jgi:hypothetical protein